MGAVYRARDMRLDRLVALKVVRAELLGDPEARRRFRREAQIVARLQHPSIVAVYDYGTFPDGGAYLVMELVRGEDLRHVLQREGRLDIGGVDADPDRGVRRDRRRAPRRRAAPRPEAGEHPAARRVAPPAKVLDFGVAKLVVDEPARRTPTRARPRRTTALTAAGMIIGTPAYMAPEQFHAVEADARTDVFSLGVVAYEMLSGELPFGRGSLADVVLAQSRGVPPLPPDTRPAAAERAIRSALDADPDRRPATPQAFATMLSAALETIADSSRSRDADLRISRDADHADLLTTRTRITRICSSRDHADLLVARDADCADLIVSRDADPADLEYS